MFSISVFFKFLIQDTYSLLSTRFWSSIQSFDLFYRFLVLFISLQIFYKLSPPLTLFACFKPFIFSAYYISKPSVFHVLFSSSWLTLPHHTNAHRSVIRNHQAYFNGIVPNLVLIYSQVFHLLTDRRFITSFFVNIQRILCKKVFQSYIKF